jgi:DNA polymerase III delta prime subunit
VEKKDLALLENNMFDNLFVEKYRPKTLKDIILSPGNIAIIDEFNKKKEIPNLLFLGNPGIGKTTLAKVLVTEVLDCQYIYLNASDENGIDTIRNKVITFSKTKSFDGKIKVIILDEADALSVDAQRALRNTMEEYSGFTRFILTGNYKYKIIPALLSRCQTLDLTPPFNEVVIKCHSILKAENINIPDKKQFINFVKSYYPDLRKCINELQKYSLNKELTLDTFSVQSIIPELHELVLRRDVIELRKFLINSEAKFNSDYVSLLREFFKYVDRADTEIERKKLHLLIISDYLYKSAFVVDQEINCYS